MITPQSLILFLELLKGFTSLLSMAKDLKGVAKTDIEALQELLGREEEPSEEEFAELGNSIKSLTKRLEKLAVD